MMRILKAFLISIAVSTGTFFVAGIALGIFNIYLAGHGIDWPNQNFETGMTGMSPLSVALAVIVLSVFLLIFVIVLRTDRNKKSLSQ